MKKHVTAVIIGNGEKPPVGFLKRQCASDSTLILCADGGLHHLNKIGITPHMLIGDLDSVTKEDLAQLHPDVKVKKITGQEDTDVEKCIKIALAKKAARILLFSVSGGRLDHTFNNLSLLSRYNTNAEILLITRENIVQAVSGTIQRKVKRGSYVSFYPIDKSLKIVTTGLQYIPPSETITPGVNNSTSNVAKDELITFNISGGTMLLFLQLQGNKLV